MKPKDQNYSKSRRLKNQIKAVVTNPYNVIVLIAIVLLTYLIVLPLLDMISTSFTLAQKDARLAGGAAGDFTLYYWQRLLGSSLTKQMLLQPLLNSLLIGVCVSFFAIMIGSVLAWLMVRTDLPFKPFFSLAVIIPYMIPSWCKSQAWLTMFKTERIGGAPGFLMSMGINVPDWLAYGPVAIIAVLSLHYYAYAYLLVSAALNSINSELEEMGEIQGAGKATILRKITLPLVLPSMLSAIILTFSKAIGTFGVINYLGSKVNFVTLSSQLYMNSKSQNTQTAFAMALIMICLASISVFVNQKLIGSQVLRHHRRQGRPFHSASPRQAQADHHSGPDRVLHLRYHHADRAAHPRVLHAPSGRLLSVQPHAALLDRRSDRERHGRPAGYLQE